MFPVTLKLYWIKIWFSWLLTTLPYFDGQCQCSSAYPYPWQEMNWSCLQICGVPPNLAKWSLSTFSQVGIHLSRFKQDWVEQPIYTIGHGVQDWCSHRPLFSPLMFEYCPQEWYTCYPHVKVWSRFLVCSTTLRTTQTFRSCVGMWIL